MTKLCSNKAILHTGEYDIENNAWGTTNPLPPQCVFGPPDADIGWQWDWSGNDASKIMGYPEIIFGKKPFNQASTTTQLPRPINDLDQLHSDFSYQIDANGAWNVAFDLWLTNSASADEKSIAVEVMIWVLGNGLTPAGNRIATVKTPNGSSQFYGGKMQYWNYFAFVLDRQMHFGSIDLNAYLKYLVNENLISTNLCLASVEFGTEIAFGGGDFSLAEYEVKIG